MLHRKLVDLGLSEKEAKVYISALQLGASPVQKIAQKANVNRATTYTNIDALMKMGLMSSYKEGKKCFFYSEPPEKIVYILIKKQQELLERKERELELVIPQLKALQVRLHSTPVVRYFDGREGVKALVKDVFQSAKENEEFRIIYPMKYVMDMFDEETLKELRDFRKKHNITSRVIISSDDVQERESADIIRISPSELPINCDIACYGDQLRLISLKEPLTGIAIRDPHIAESFKAVFDLLWKNLKENKKK